MSAKVLLTPPRMATTSGVNHHEKNNRKKNNQRLCRKRMYCGNLTTFPYKRWKKDFTVPPTKFLLGGNIRDPLNLNSLQDEEVNRRLNAPTPETSPAPTPQWKKSEVEIVWPPNIYDPLNLNHNSNDNDNSDELNAAKKKKRNKKKKILKDNKERLDSENKSDESKTDESLSKDNSNTSIELEESVNIKEDIPIKMSNISNTAATISKPNSLNLVISEKSKIETTNDNKTSNNTSQKNLVNKKCFFESSKSKIVSPVIPQPGSWARKKPKLPSKTMPQFKEKNKTFQYGNYNRYYGYRNAGQQEDQRLKLFSENIKVFMGKEILDIGCNTGLISISIARDFKAKSVVGIDVDRKLINLAKAQLKLYKKNNEGTFPLSMKAVFGPLEFPGISDNKSFPYNISFIQGNYVLESDVLLSLEQPQFDVILCLSITKWFHLNWGDEGLKRAFHRMYLQLRPGGVLILEPQPFSSYKRKKNLTETIWKNYNNIQLKPEKFNDFLLYEVGFSKCEILGAPYHVAKGFRRPIRMFTKSAASPKTDKTPLINIDDKIETTDKKVLIDEVDTIETTDKRHLIDVVDNPVTSGKTSLINVDDKIETVSSSELQTAVDLESSENIESA